jgi:acetyl esterase/lipase
MIMVKTTSALVGLTIVLGATSAQAAGPTYPVQSSGYQLIAQRIAYGPATEYQVADVYAPGMPACVPGHARCTPPVAFLIHGGWTVCKNDGYESMTGQAHLFAWAGFFTIIVQSEPNGPRCPNPAGHDIGSLQLAVRWLRKYGHQYRWNFDPDRIVAVGGSASGYNALTLGEWGWAGIQPSAFSQIDAGVPANVQAVIDEFGPGSGPDGSVIKQMITPESVPTYIIQGIYDCFVPKANSDRITAALQANSVLVSENYYVGSHNWTEWIGPTCRQQPIPPIFLGGQFMYDQVYPGITWIMAQFGVTPVR